MSVVRTRGREVEMPLLQVTGGLCGFGNRCSQTLPSYEVSSCAVEAQVWEGVGESGRKAAVTGNGADRSACQDEVGASRTSGAHLFLPDPGGCGPLPSIPRWTQDFKAQFFHM